MLTQEQIDSFYQDGYTVVKNVIPKDELPYYREAFERMVAKVQANPIKEYGTRYLSEKNNQGNLDEPENRKRETWGCNALLHPDLYEKAFTDFIDKEHLLSALSSILGPTLRMSGLKALWSSDIVDYDLIWHRDGPNETFTPDGSQSHIQFNTALYKDTSFRLIPGSHRRPLTEEELSFSRTKTDPLTDEVNPHLEAGDSLFMHSHLLHRGSAKAGAKRRTFHTIIASIDKPVYEDEFNKTSTWYNSLSIEDTLGSHAKILFDNFLSWQDRTHEKPKKS